MPDMPNLETDLSRTQAPTAAPSSPSGSLEDALANSQQPSNNPDTSLGSKLQSFGTGAANEVGQGFGTIARVLNKYGPGNTDINQQSAQTIQDFQKQAQDYTNKQYALNPLSTKAGEWSAIGAQLAFPLAALSKWGIGKAMSIIDGASATPASIAARISEGLGDLSTTSPTDFVNAAKKTFENANQERQALFKARDTYADSKGISINPENTANYIKENGIPLDTIIQKQFLGKDALSLSEAETLASKLGTKAHEAYTSTTPNSTAGKAYQDAQNILKQDINTAAMGDSKLADLHDIANAHYQNTFLPLKNLINDTADSSTLTDEIGHRLFVNQIAKHLGSPMSIGGETRKGLDVLGNTGGPTQASLVASKMNGIKDMATNPQTGELNMPMYLKNLSQFTSQMQNVNPQLSQRLSTISDIMGMFPQAAKGEDSAKLVAGLAGGHEGGVGGAVAGLAGITGIKKLGVWNRVGSALSDPSSTRLLDVIGNSPDLAIKNPALQQSITKSILSKLLPASRTANVISPQETNNKQATNNAPINTPSSY